MREPSGVMVAEPGQDVRGWQAQRGRVDYYGRPLQVDGSLGPRTRWAMYIETLAPWRQVAVRVALSARGMAELPGNRGHLIDFALELCGAPKGSPWCAALYSWALWVAGVPWGSGFRPSARVVDLRDALKPVPVERVLPGDFACWANPDGATGHGGMVIWPGVDHMASLDGNIGDECDLIRYPAKDRQYYAPEPGYAHWLGEPPKEIRLYRRGNTR